MRIKGELIDFEKTPTGKVINDIAEIELAPVDTSKLKVGDEVLVRLKITEAKALCSCHITAVDSEKDYISIYTKDIVAHIPQPEEPKKVELPEKIPYEIKLTSDEYVSMARLNWGSVAKMGAQLEDLRIAFNQALDYLRELKEKEGKA